MTFKDLKGMTKEQLAEKVILLEDSLKRISLIANDPQKCAAEFNRSYPDPLSYDAFAIGFIQGIAEYALDQD